MEAIVWNIKINMWQQKRGVIGGEEGLNISFDEL